MAITLEVIQQVAMRIQGEILSGMGDPDANKCK